MAVARIKITPNPAYAGQQQSICYDFTAAPAITGSRMIEITYFPSGETRKVEVTDEDPCVLEFSPTGSTGVNVVDPSGDSIDGSGTYY
jgi:hypothetical protein